MSYPIPIAALDDRLGFVGTSGSGKTYCSGTAVEHVLKGNGRVAIVDPLGAWYGLRLLADGKTPSRYDVVIFGGAHGDIPINESAGAVIGETVAGMSQSCIIDLSDEDQFQSDAGARRFMLAFLRAVYSHASREPLHLIFDEADMWAPQRILDKDGDAAKLLGKMQHVVRRGRLLGFIPWLITQRPAEVSKGVLSQVDGLVIMKLTSSQDRDAIGDWVEGQADRAQWRSMWSELPTYQVGHGLVWIPGRGVFEPASFPAKLTYDSSRAPKRGEKLSQATLTALDLPALRKRLAIVEAELKDSDPRALKAENAKLRQQLASPVNQAAIESRGYARGQADAVIANDRAVALFRQAWDDFAAIYRAPNWQRLSDTVAALLDSSARKLEADLRAGCEAPRPPAAPHPSNGGLTPALQRVLDAVAWWRKIGIEPVDRARASVVAGYSPRASTFHGYVAALSGKGLIEVVPGAIKLTDAGRALANAPTATTAAELRTMARNLLGPQQARVFDAIYQSYPDAIRRDDVAKQVGLSAQASTVHGYIANVAAYGIIEPDGRGSVRAAEWLFP